MWQIDGNQGRKTLLSLKKNKTVFLCASMYREKVPVNILTFHYH
jgi:hypothetical protein